MANIMSMTVAVACTLALTACGGGGDGNGDNTLSRSDEGIWSNLDGGSQYGMQTVILNDGSYWSFYGDIENQNDVSPTSIGGVKIQNGMVFFPLGVLQGTASVSGSSVSGTYADFLDTAAIQGTYSGTVSAQKNLNMVFHESSNMNGFMAESGGSFNMNYDSIYDQPASLTAIAGNYQGKDCILNSGGGVTELCYVSSGGSPVLPGESPPAPIPLGLTISGSNLSIGDGTEMTGTIAPHGTVANVFDVSLTPGTAADPNLLPAGRVYKGILFQTSGSPGYIEIIAAAGSDAYFYTGSK
jgi:hypothetical protein